MAWYDPSWDYRIPITLESSEITADQTDFPIYVDLGDLPSVSFWAHVLNGGGDIRVTKSDGTTELPREVVSCNTTTEVGELHLKYSGTLSSSSDTDVYIYYGNSGASDYATDATYGAENVWDSNFVYVSHDGGGNDSTSNGIGHTAGGDVTSGNATGKCGDATYFDGDGDTITVSENSALDMNSFSVEFWINPGETASTSSGSDLLSSKSAPGGKANYLWFYNHPGSTVYKSFSLYDTTWRFAQLTTTPTAGSWQHLAGRYGGGQLRSHYNGSQEGNISASGTPQKGDSGISVCSSTLEATIDEYRISNVARALSWLTTSYNNQNNTSTFYAVGAEEIDGATDLLDLEIDLTSTSTDALDLKSVVGDTDSSALDLRAVVSDKDESNLDARVEVLDRDSAPLDMRAVISDTDQSLVDLKATVSDTAEALLDMRAEIESTGMDQNVLDQKIVISDVAQSALDLRVIASEQDQAVLDLLCTLYETAQAQLDCRVEIAGPGQSVLDMTTTLIDRDTSTLDFLCRVAEAAQAGLDLRAMIVDQDLSAVDVKVIVSDVDLSQLDLLAVISLAQEDLDALDLRADVVGPVEQSLDLRADIDAGGTRQPLPLDLRLRIVGEDNEYYAPGMYVYRRIYGEKPRGE